MAWLSGPQLRPGQDYEAQKRGAEHAGGYGLGAGRENHSGEGAQSPSKVSETLAVSLLSSVWVATFSMCGFTSLKRLRS